MYLKKDLEKILSVIQNLNGNSDLLAYTLRHNQIPHISFSQISTVEFCQRRYFLDYVLMIDPDPLPDYFTKGRFLHQLIASYYKNIANEKYPDIQEYYAAIDQNYSGKDPQHLKNAFTTQLHNFWQGFEIVGVEEPFAFLVDDQIPVCVGIIDLILKRDDQWILVDHKTGRDFYPYDQLQMAIYLEYVKLRFGAVNCRFFYDHYRWVNNLNRIRKPAFQRTEVFIDQDYWGPSLDRIKQSYQSIQIIKETNHASFDGECFRCPYRNQCW